jgi:hypothetical protein
MWYLEKRVNEWLAAGGYVEWKTNFQFFIKFLEHPIAGGRLGKWWMYARFPFRLDTKPPVLKKYYYQTLED